jgi:hypothetical protein
MASTSAPQVRKLGPVHITLPASVAYNMSALKETVRSAMERLSCPTCFSGLDCHFSVERNLFVEENRKVSGNPPPVPWSAMSPQPLPWHAAVGFQGRVVYNIDQVLQVVEKVTNSLGCLPCHSGWDVSYINEVTLIGVDPDLQVTTYGGQLSA